MSEGLASVPAELLLRVLPLNTSEITSQNWFGEVRRKFNSIEKELPHYAEWKPQYLDSSDGVNESTLMRLNLVSLSLTERPLDVRVAKWAVWLSQ